MNTSFKLSFIIFVGLTLTACNTSGNKSTQDPKSNILSRIDTLESKTYDDAFRSSPDLNLLRRLSALYDSFSTAFPDDTTSPEFLFKAGQLNENALSDNTKAIMYYSNAYKNYPNWRKREFMLFALGNAYHNLGDTTKAVESLSKFSRQNPTHEFADDALNLIKFIRMSKAEVDSLFK
ncbi:MAG: hypothetical protein A3H98_04575 [Bacteroidetes bacterium RIFCSPLOWO2_02_FULL_36_8]|nr:MAG: hypothetical protein A3H98_04575 [Bacteroidetes bacterium RIFCSPLOWO2_02_FULL_36_8]OFY70059.1 MAG: hypothetical protein A3G23_13510 [Bacteroidetes bacterium RIFCSPLOWO2_12_FULL_37_12]